MPCYFGALTPGNLSGSRGTAWNRSNGPNFQNAPRQNTQFPPLAGSQQRPEPGYDPKLLSTLANMIVSENVIISNANVNIFPFNRTLQLFSRSSRGLATKASFRP